MAVIIIHTEAKHGDQDRTIPLSTHAGVDRQAVVIAGWQGAGHGQADMSTGPIGPLTVRHRTDRSATWYPGIAVWAGLIPTGTADVELPISHGGCGWALYVVESVDLDALTVDSVVTGDLTSYPVTASDTPTDLVIGAVSNNTTATVTTGTLTAVQCSPAWYSDIATGYTTIGTDSTLSWTVEDQVAALTVTIPEGVDVSRVWTDTVAGDMEIVTGSAVGAGVGDDVATTDLSGATNTAGSPIVVIDKCTVDPMPASWPWSTRLTLPADYDVTQGYRVLMQAEDSLGNARGPQIEAGTIVGGETVGVFSADVPITPQPVRWTDLELLYPDGTLPSGVADAPIVVHRCEHPTWINGQLIAFHAHANGNTYRSHFGTDGTLSEIDTTPGTPGRAQWCMGPTGDYTYTGITSVLVEAGTLHCWTHNEHHISGHQCFIGHGTASDLSGYAWTHDDPLVVSGQDPQPSGFRGASGPCVVKMGDNTFTMVYTNRFGDGRWNEIYRATCPTVDGTWTVQGSIVQEDPAGPYYYAEAPRLYWSDTHAAWLLTYDTDLGSRYRTSADTITWSAATDLVPKEQAYTQTAGYRRWYATLIDETKDNHNELGTGGLRYTDHHIGVVDNTDRWPSTSFYSPFAAAGDDLWIRVTADPQPVSVLRPTGSTSPGRTYGALTTGDYWDLLDMDAKVGATQRWVDNANGSDSNSGTSESLAWATIGHAFTQLAGSSGTIWLIGSHPDIGEVTVKGSSRTAIIALRGVGTDATIASTAATDSSAIKFTGTFGNIAIHNIHFEHQTYRTTASGWSGSRGCPAIEISGKDFTTNQLESNVGALWILNNHLEGFGHGIGGVGAPPLIVAGNFITQNGWYATGGGSGVSTTDLGGEEGGTAAGWDLDPIYTAPDGTAYHFVHMGNVAYDNRQKVISDHPDVGANYQTDGNGMILGNSEGTPSSLRALSTLNVCFGNGGQGINIYDCMAGGVDVVLNTCYGNGAHHYDGLPLNKAGLWTHEILFGKELPFPVDGSGYVAGNIAVCTHQWQQAEINWYNNSGQGYSVTGPANSNVVADSGGTSPSSPSSAMRDEGTSTAGILNSLSLDIQTADVGLPAGSPARNIMAASLRKTDWDFTGAAMPTTGTIDAGAVQHEAGAPATVPGSVRSLAAVEGDAQVGLSWLPPLNDGGEPLTGYGIEYRTGGGAWVPYEIVQATSTTVTGLTNGIAYEFAVKAGNVVGASIAAVVAATPAAGSTSPVGTGWLYYGCPWGEENLANNRLYPSTPAGHPTATAAKQISHRFVAKNSGSCTGIKQFMIANTSRTGYASGNGGTIRVQLVADDGTGLPDETTVHATTDWVPGLVNGCGSFGCTSYTANHPMNFAYKYWGTPYTLVAGTTYHIVYTNIDASPATNYISVDDGFANSAGRNPLGPQEDDWGLCVNFHTGFGWQESTNREAHSTQSGTYDPCLMIVYSDGSLNFGNAYLTESGSGLRDFGVSGNNQVRQVFTPTSTMSATHLSFMSNGSGTLDIALTSGGSTIDSWSEVVSHGSNQYTVIDFGGTVALTASTTYELTFSCSSGTVFMSANRDGSLENGFPWPAGATWDDGYAEMNTGTGWTQVNGFRYDLSGVCFKIT